MIDRYHIQNIYDALASERRKIIILYGARQVGKTTLINKVLLNYNGNILHINGDESRFMQILSSRNVESLKGLTSGYDLVFIDEAQRIPDIGINLKIIHDQIPSLKVIITGSSSLDLASKVKEPLTGRTDTFILFPISLSELRNTDNLNAYELKQKVYELMTYGMYPEVLSIANIEAKKKHLSELTSSYLYKDILDLANIKHTQKIEPLLKLLAYQVGNEVSIHEISNTLSIHRESVIRYLDLLEKSFVISRLSGFSRNLRKEITKMDKIYFIDLGIRNAIIGDFGPIQFRRDKGSLWENFIYIEKLKYNNEIKRFSNFYFWRTYSGAEIDLIEEYDGKLYGIELKLGDKVARKPKKWSDTYPDAEFTYANEENFLEIF